MLSRCNKYGHDQIQFNNVLARSYLEWNEPNYLLNLGQLVLRFLVSVVIDVIAFEDNSSHEANITWFHQKDPDFILFNVSNANNIYRDYGLQHQLLRNLTTNQMMSEDFYPTVKLPVENKDYEIIKLLLLKRNNVLRYCNNAQKIRNDYINYLNVSNDLTTSDIKSITSLHCFIETGPIG